MSNEKLVETQAQMKDWRTDYSLWIRPKAVQSSGGALHIIQMRTLVSIMGLNKNDNNMV